MSEIEIKVDMMEGCIIDLSPDPLHFRCPHCDGIIGIVAKGGKPVRTVKYVSECKQCGAAFERAGNGTDGQRRSSAIFCSEACKNRFHYLKRRDT